MLEEAIVLAGGLGLRLKEVLKDVPKPLADINGRPFIDYLLKNLIQQGMKKIIIAAGCQHEKIREFLEKYYHDFPLIYSIEDVPLGTGGAVKKALNFVSDNCNHVFVFNGDSYINVCLRKFYEFHLSKNSDLSLCLKFMQDSSRYGAVTFDSQRQIKGFKEKIQAKSGFINAGVYLLNKEWFHGLQLADRFSLEKDVLEKYYSQSQFYGVIGKGYFIDIGAPCDYERAKKELKDEFSS
ncbi:MAG: D-glycero-D-manno-heptose 1-phosphate guanosyltransferase [Candidatus Omnitrophota bacterium]|nr:MAG: D-glycero-D-manno-heptose 1-phosphate guanosyltransferase [Candidatus Omnitrophota bacterium]